VKSGQGGGGGAGRGIKVNTKGRKIKISTGATGAIIFIPEFLRIFEARSLYWHGGQLPCCNKICALCLVLNPDNLSVTVNFLN
jgi:hypothetical protein